jgi:Lactate racemase N-terminal domain
MTAFDPDDLPVIAGADLDAPDPLAVFRHPELPRWGLVRQRIDATEIDDVAAAVEAAIATVAGVLRPGQRVCLAVGSRGIDRIAEVTAAAVASVRARGAAVFVVPAMGSHGGATADGQLAVLASLGVTESTIGAEIRSSMDVVRIGEVDGIPVVLDRHAATEADVIIPINRVKPHTDFTGPVESGLLKMIAIGLAKQVGADTFHGRGFAQFAELIPAVAAHTLARVNIPFGLALLENGHARLRRIEAVPAAAMYEREQVLRDEADGYLARLPIAALDVLVIDRIGKDISGLGMDSNVVGRYYTGPTGRGPSIQRIVVRDLSDETEGNAVGIGMADVVVRRAVDRMDAVSTYMNCITAKTPEGARIALMADTDRQAIDIAIACCLNVTATTARIARILDTKHLGWFYASEVLLAELRDDDRCEMVAEPAPIGVDAAGRLTDPLQD